jgi:hypothetical protein
VRYIGGVIRFKGYLVPEVGLEPTRTQGPLDFESSTSTNFITPATFQGSDYNENLCVLSI